MAKNSILVVDDEKSVVSVISEILKNEGYQVYEAEDGRQALEHLGIDPPNDAVKLPDLVILDIMMPVVDGYTVASRMQDGLRTRQIPVVILTAKGPMKEVFDAAPNVRAYIEKPFEPNRLRKTVKKILRS